MKIGFCDIPVEDEEWTDFLFRKEHNNVITWTSPLLAFSNKTLPVTDRCPTQKASSVELFGISG